MKIVGVRLFFLNGKRFCYYTFIIKVENLGISDIENLLLLLGFSSLGRVGSAQAYW